MSHWACIVWSQHQQCFSCSLSLEWWTLQSRMDPQPTAKTYSLLFCCHICKLLHKRLINWCWHTCMLAAVMFRRAKWKKKLFSLLNFCSASFVVSAITGSSMRSAVGQSGQVCTIAVAATVRVMQIKSFYKVNSEVKRITTMNLRQW